MFSLNTKPVTEKAQELNSRLSTALKELRKAEGNFTSIVKLACQDQDWLDWFNCLGKDQWTRCVRLSQILSKGKEGAGALHRALYPKKRGKKRKSDVAQADVAQADVAQADVAQADVAQADVAQADVAQADVAQADVAQADVAQADVAQADVAQADVLQARINLALHCLEQMVQDNNCLVLQGILRGEITTVVGC